MDNEKHLTDEQLALYQDGDLPINYVLHLKSCSKCSRRLYDVVRATEAFQNYLETVRKPLHPPPPKPWKSLSILKAQHEDRRHWTFRWWPTFALATAFAGVIAFVALYPQGEDTESNKANRLLTQSSEMTHAIEGRISMTVHGRTFFRPAVLNSDAPNDPAVAKIQAAFIRANYSWREPLSARSFLVWRGKLKKKRDTVSVIGTGSHRAYRVHTDNPGGSLRSASLTLQASDMRPTTGSFDFAEEGAVDLATADAASPEKTSHNEPARTVEKSQPEIPATPDDTLHVLAALNEIGADVDDPLFVAESADRRKIVVRGNGIDPQRQTQIANALKSLPRAIVDFTQSATNTSSSGEKQERFTANIPASIRKRLEDRIGGAIALQEMTDQTLDLSSSLIARVHALQILAEKFPPSIEQILSRESNDLLRTLRQKHLKELNLLFRQISMKLKPLIAPSTESSLPMTTGRWQNNVDSLAKAARDLNASLNRLLAGNYSEASGEEMIRNLAPQLAHLDTTIRNQ